MGVIAIILAGGYAKRLWPLTRDKPKPLLPVAGRPIIEYILDKLNSLSEVEHIIISTNLRFENYFRGFAARNYSVEIIADRSRCEEEKPGAVAALAEITSNIHSDCLIIAGDNLFTADLRGMINFYREKLSPIVALYDVGEKELAKHYAAALLDKDGRIIDFEEKPQQPKTTLIGTCIYIFPERILSRLREYVEEGLERDQPGKFIEWLHRREAVYGYVLNGYWWDIGTEESYNKANKFFLNITHPNRNTNPQISISSL